MSVFSVFLQHMANGLGARVPVCASIGIGLSMVYGICA